MRISTLLLTLFVAIAVVLFLAWSRVPDMVATSLAQKMQVPVEVGSMQLRPTSLKVNTFEIGNPPHSILPIAFSAQSILVDAPLTRYLNSHIVIDEITISDVYLGLEFNSASGTDGNWTTILNNLERTSKQAPTGESKRSVLIKKLVLLNLNAEVVYRKEGGRPKKLPTIPRMELDNISSEGGLPVEQITDSVLGQMLQKVFIQQNLKNMLENLTPGGNPINRFLGPAQGLFGAEIEEIEQQRL